jgi:hypothetical protein
VFVIDPQRVSPQMRRDSLALYLHCIDVTEPATLAYDTDRPTARYNLLVPSDTHSGLYYEVRVIAGRNRWWAVHYGEGCPAHQRGSQCKHLYAAALWVSQYATGRGGQPRFGGRIPVPYRRKRTPANPKPAPRVRHGALSGFYA